ncbi:BolA family protein [Leptospira stimsonii]|uniref:BolA family transcriptional regulator n=1 Tax=Leptospira stimsonii TaxID=2202203 RepID=A0A4R9L506_9LEPT|nr:BolA family protein [Leptospira stimsonii]RHX86592.1 BolA family transcriptional regulator [Leptospira stimsonii]TGK13424.1 BolA family transcriptional regulator [Leptospira stimsonii]TGM11657.1 BolA family transcriptional regulator [Leptospira stimsonii]
MDIQEEIRTRLEREFHPSKLEVVDFSEEHSGHAGNPTNKKGGTHIRIVLFSTAFAGKSKVEQHREVYSILKPWIDRGLHAIVLETGENE